MANPKDLLVVTTSSIEGIKIKSYLKPVSAHIVAGTNLFSDFFAGFTDVFGGRSQTYQKQLVSLYNEAIDRVKMVAYEIGANAILGLKIDMDEISGKGKSMFMLTAIGTAVIVEKKDSFEANVLSGSEEMYENIGVDRVNNLRRKKAIIDKAEKGDLDLTDEIWDFVTSNQVPEVYPFLLKGYKTVLLNYHSSPDYFNQFHNLFFRYIDALEDEQKRDLLYNSIASEEEDNLVIKLSQIVKGQSLFDYNRILNILKDEDFEVQKRGIRLSVYDKPFYNKQDMENLRELAGYLNTNFPERGKHSTKKQLLSSKEKEIWICECGKTNDIGEYCTCGKDIYGFRSGELKPKTAANYLQEKIELISEFII